MLGTFQSVITCVVCINTSCAHNRRDIFISFDRRRATRGGGGKIAAKTLVAIMRAPAEVSQPFVELFVYIFQMNIPIEQLDYNTQEWPELRGGKHFNAKIKTRFWLKFA